MERIAPVFVLTAGGSTMISDVLNRHPKLLSLSEVFSLLGLRALAKEASQRQGDVGVVQLSESGAAHVAVC